MTTPKPAPTFCLSGRSSKRSPILRQIFILSAILLWAGFASAYSGGDGYRENPYQIATAANLLELGADVNNYNKYFILTADINLAEYDFHDAVIAPGYYNSPAFTGSFDGAGHKISNLTINAEPDYEYYGLFGHTTFALIDDRIWEEYYYSEIKNLTIENVRITISIPSVAVGGLVGANDGVPITNCHSSVTIINTVPFYRLGGLIGSNNGNISNCSSEGSIFLNYTACSHDFTSAGGLIGINSAGNINDSHSDCNFICNISSCEDPTAGSAVWVGGLVGQNNGYPYDCTINNCYSTGNINGTINGKWLTFYAGGLVGLNHNAIQKCYSIGGINLWGGNDNIGGLVGANGGEVNDCYSTGPVNGIVSIDSGALGGLVGYNESMGIIKNCYSIGEVDPLGGSGYAGGLVGDQFGSVITHSYFLDVNGPDNGLGTPLTDAQMKQQASFIGWDFLGETINGTQEIWRMCEDGIRYPLLYWQFSPADFNCPDGVNFIDFAALANWWLFDNCAANNNCGRTDMDLSGNIDIYDLKLFCDHWLDGM